MSDYSRIFLEDLPEDGRAAIEALDDLEGRLLRLVAEARDAWPELDLADETFLPYAAQRIDLSEDAARAIGKIRSGDLYLACACAQGEQKAIAAFRVEYLPKIRAALLNIGLAELVDEISQELVAKLLVAQDQARPGICKYNGRGNLAAWVQVTAVRMARRQDQKTRREHLCNEDYLFDRAMPEHDPELRHLKLRCRAQFKMAFQRAFDSLEVRERAILHYEIEGGMNIEQIGAIYGVHRSSVARWRASCRQKLLKTTKQIFREDFEVGGIEFDSIVRLIQSQLEVSLPRLLEEEDQAL